MVLLAPFNVYYIFFLAQNFYHTILINGYVLQENFDKLLDQAAIAEGEDPVDLDLLWVNAAGGAKKGKRVFGMGSEARSVLEKTQYVLKAQQTRQDNAEIIQEEMRASVQQVREEITQNNQRWEMMFEKLIQGQTTLAEQMKSFGKKKGPRGI